jgi:phosphate butyryltransferase
MFRNYSEMRARAAEMGPVPVSVAAADDKGVIGAVKIAMELGMIRPILVGEERKIRALLEEEGISGELRVVDSPDAPSAALAAVERVRRGEARVLVKGQVNTSDFMRAVLDKNVGLRTGKLVSGFAVFEIPGEKKLVFQADGGVNVAPRLAEKREILLDALAAMARFGIERPKVAVLTANEQVNPKMPATVDAAELVRMSREEGFPPCVVEGPIAMDVALDPEMARRKGLKSEVAGDVDLYIMPNIESGNIMGKLLVHYMKAKMAGIVLGVSAPVVLTSRGESSEGKVNSIALACLASKELA